MTSRPRSLLAERGIEVDHVTVYRWVQRFTPLLAEDARPCPLVERKTSVWACLPSQIVAGQAPANLPLLSPASASATLLKVGLL
jgi:hypothetical protein